MQLLGGTNWMADGSGIENVLRRRARHRRQGRDARNLVVADYNGEHDDSEHTTGAALRPERAGHHAGFAVAERGARRAIEGTR